VLILAATNREDLIDPAVLRSGRFDLTLRFPLPDEEDRLEILKIHCRGKPLADDVALEGVAAATDGLSGSDLRSLCQDVSRRALREFLGEGRSERALFVRKGHFDQALRKFSERKG
jgi:transitional endoplasmic reticulum ATPase